jgi:acetyl-CoA carboxylase biotin carboxylase subunit
MDSSKKLLHYRKFKRVLIANRGEIALRVIRSCRDLGIESVAVYSDADSESLHRYQADYAVRLPGNLSADTYLNIPALMDAVKKSGADAVHPGYGFLSESSIFARAIWNSDIVFIGPDPVAMEKMGNKIEARNLMMAGGVPVVPGAKEPLADITALRKMAKEIGYPMILKAAGGGGGRGMRVVRADDQLEPSFDACKREAVAYFGNPDVFCERYIDFPRHIEFQVMFDSHGNGVHLFERDCSIQRRHQKLIEEAPSTFLTDKTRMEIGARAIAAARATGYVGAGTIEFICESPEKIYFMEMNTRIQVEHPVTEMITGVDLIATQMTVAMGEPLPFKQEDLKINGWSFEARINTEDALRNFAPSPGTVTQLRLPSGPFVRVDSHLYPGYTIPEFYDSMVAKVITWGRNRDEAMARLARALGEMRIEGVPTTAPFHEALLADKNFREGKFTTRFIEENEAKLKESMSQLSTEYPNLFAAAGAVLSQSPPPIPSVSEERKEWLMTGRLQGMN